jgi:hypothetical protein
MNTRAVITIILLVFVVASVAYLIAHESRSGEQDAAPDGTVMDLVVNESRSGDREAASDAAVTGDGTPHKVIAYYFHGDKRCRTCLSIEAYTREAIEEGFPQQLESGELELRIVNVDEPANQHFIDDYRLTTKSVIIADYRSGVEEHWKNLNLVWEYVNDKETFLDYVRRETEDFLGGSADE